jgi:hypothetical protein
MPPLVSERNHRGYVELRNVRVLLEEARGLSRNLAYHRRTRLETKIGDALDVCCQVQAHNSLIRP